VRDSAGNESYHTNDGQGIRLHGRYLPDPVEGIEKETYSPALTVAAANAVVGSAVTGSGFLHASFGAETYSVSYSSNSVPLGFESVSVPAGVFIDALRVQTSVTYSYGQATWHQSINVWLVPGIGIVKRISFDSSDGSSETAELVSYSVPDTVPDAFSFAPKTVLPDQLATSDPVTVTGINAPAPISVSGGEYSIDGGPWTTQGGMVVNNQQVRVSRRAPAPNVSASATLSIGGVRADFVVTGFADSTPNPFGFVAVQGVPAGVAITSNAVPVSGINTASPISIIGGEYSIDGQTFTSAPGFVVPTPYGLRLRVVSSTTPGATVSATVTIGGVSGSFSATTAAPGPERHTVLYFDSPAGDYIGQGERRIFSLLQPPQSGVTTTFTATRSIFNPRALHFEMRQSSTGSQDESFFLDIHLPGAGIPRPGRYEGALRYPFNETAPGLDFAGNGRGCNILRGRFDILEAIYADNGDVVRFAANFEQYCEYHISPLVGQLRINSALALGSNVLRRVRADLNGDTRSDVLWRNSSSGESYLWPLQGTAIVAGEGYVRTVPSADWQIVAKADLDGDGKSDILWRNAGTGENYVFFMDGFSIRHERYLRWVAAPWQIAAAGDFDGDGKDDILWRNAATGETYLYLMNAFSIANESPLRTIDTSWQVAGVGDFDGDGKADILWRNVTSGENYVYFMNGVSIVAEGYLRTVADTNWEIKGCGDLDGDGKADVLWRNSNTGENYAYLMNGLAIVNEGYLRTVAGPSWQIAALGDYDGDGKTDILWRNAATGENYLYPMDGTAIKPSEGYLRNVPPGSWSIVAR
jgi:hypothetical protein